MFRLAILLVFSYTFVLIASCTLAYPDPPFPPKPEPLPLAFDFPFPAPVCPSFFRCFTRVSDKFCARRSSSASFSLFFRIFCCNASSSASFRSRARCAASLFWLRRIAGRRCGGAFFTLFGSVCDDAPGLEDGESLPFFAGRGAGDNGGFRGGLSVMLLAEFFVNHLHSLLHGNLCSDFSKGDEEVNHELRHAHCLLILFLSMAKTYTRLNGWALRREGSLKRKD